MDPPLGAASGVGAGGAALVGEGVGGASRWDITTAPSSRKRRGRRASSAITRWGRHLNVSRAQRTEAVRELFKTFANKSADAVGQCASAEKRGALAGRSRPHVRRRDDADAAPSSTARDRTAGAGSFRSTDRIRSIFAEACTTGDRRRRRRGINGGGWGPTPSRPARHLPGVARRFEGSARRRAESASSTTTHNADKVRAAVSTGRPAVASRGLPAARVRSARLPRPALAELLPGSCARRIGGASVDLLRGGTVARSVESRSRRRLRRRCGPATRRPPRRAWIEQDGEPGDTVLIWAPAIPTFRARSWSMRRCLGPRPRTLRLPMCGCVRLALVRIC